VGVTDEQLQRVWQNRQRTSWRRQPPKAVGEIASAWKQASSRPGSAWRAQLAEVIEEGGAGEVLQQAALFGVRDGVLVLVVESAPAAYAMNLQWQQQLLELFYARLPQAGIHSVRFEHRRDGTLDARSSGGRDA